MMGCTGSDEPGLYGSATRKCVADFYHAAGYDPMPSSPTEAADLAAAEQAVADAEFTLEEIKPTVSSRSPTFARAVDARDRAVAALDALRAVTGPTVSEVASPLCATSYGESARLPSKPHPYRTQTLESPSRR